MVEAEAVPAVGRREWKEVRDGVTVQVGRAGKDPDRAHGVSSAHAPHQQSKVVPHAISSRDAAHAPSLSSVSFVTAFLKYFECFFINRLGIHSF